MFRRTAPLLAVAGLIGFAGCGQLPRSVGTAAAAVPLSGPAARHAAFREALHVRTPHPEWRNSLQLDSTDGRAITLAANYETDYVILLSVEPSKVEEQAATELALWLEALSGAQFTVAREGGGGVTTAPVISVGRTARREAAGLPAVDLRDDGYRIALDRHDILIEGGRRTGVLNGVYALLEEDFGCRWYQPGPDGAVIPLQTTLQWQPAARSYVSPFDELRRVDYADVANADWKRRNRVRMGNWAGRFVHTYHNLLPAERYFSSHPEYFSLIGGERRDMQICPTHPEVEQIVLGKVRDELRQNPSVEYVAIDPNDGGGACHCPSCQALIDQEGTEMAPLLHLVNVVAAGIRAEFPAVQVTTLAYLNTVVPPQNFGPAANVRTWLCTDAHAWGYGNLFIWETDKSSQAMKDWWDRWQAPLLVWDYPSLFHASQVNFNLPVIAGNLRWYVEHGANGIYFQTIHNLNHGIDHSYQRSWIFAKLGWNPNLDTQALVRDFNFGFYGAAAPHMQAYDDMLWAAWADWHKRTVATYPPPWNRDQARKEGRSGRVTVSAEFWDKAEEHLLAAEQAVADDEPLRRRVRTARLPLQYRKLESGPGNDVPAYNNLIAEYEADARAARKLIVETFVGPPTSEDLGDKVAYWKRLTEPPPKVPYRELDNLWRFAPDVDDKGMSEKWFAPDFSDLAWTSMRSDTGGGWKGKFPDLKIGWYRQPFNVTEEMLQRPTLWMLFGAVDEQAEIFINGKPAFEHTEKSTGMDVTKLWDRPFVFDARPYVVAGENTLAVRVRDTVGLAGIWRPVWFLLQDEQPEPVNTLKEIELIKTMETLKQQ